MRRTIWATLALVTLGTGSLVGVPSPAAARDYPWCIQGREEGYPGYCGFQTYAQCQATASGRNAYCGYNPRFAYGQSRTSPRAFR